MILKDIFRREERYSGQSFAKRLDQEPRLLESILHETRHVAIALSSVESESEIVLDIGLGKNNHRALASKTTTAFLRPTKIRTTTTIERHGITSEKTVYMFENYIFFSGGPDDSWLKEEYSFGNYEKIDRETNSPTALKQLLSHTDSFKVIGEEKVGQYDTVQLECNVDVRAVELMSDLDSAMENLEADNNIIMRIREAYDKDGQVRMKLWIDRWTYAPRQIKIDLTSTFTSGFGKFYRHFNNVIFDDVRINEYTIDMRFININMARNFELPVEVSQADELSRLFVDWQDRIPSLKMQ